MSSTYEYYAKATTEFQIPKVAPNHFLGDVLGSEHVDDNSPITAGLYRFEPDQPLVYTYTYHEMKLVLEGTLDVTDEQGKTINAVVGDLFHFSPGAVMTFSTKTGGLAFVTAQRKIGTA